MNIVQALILGVVEGATEYLPVSSTFHLIWAARLLGIPQTDFQKAFEVIIQVAAILAVVVLYLPILKKKIILFPKILTSFVPTAVIGLTLYKIIKTVFFEQFILQLAVFAIVGAIFVVFEKLRPDMNRSAESISFKEAVIIGLIQSLAVIPGVSRAGAVIVGLMFLKVKRDEAAEYSFLLAVPTIAAASSLDLIKTVPYLMTHRSDIGLVVVGSIGAFAMAMVSIKWLLGFLQRHTLTVFGSYRMILALLLLFITK